METKRISIVIPSLAAGGAERVVASHANWWALNGWSVTVVTCTSTFQAVFYALHPEVSHVNVDFGASASDLMDGIYRNARRLVAMRKAITESKPDCIISHMHPANIRVLIATRGLGIPVIVTEHCWQPLIPMGPLWRGLQSLTYPWADAITAPNKRILDYFPDRIQRRSIAIPNPVNVSKEKSSADSITLPDAINIVSMGRLAQQKRFDLLLKAFAAMPSKEKCHLTIVGEGTLRNQLIKLAEELRIEHCFSLPGLIRNPWSLLKDADIFVLSSEFEGLPMVMLEAMTCALPVVSFDCPVGPSDIITNGVDGLLVPPLDVKALAKAMERLINDPAERQRLGANAKKSAQRYSLDRIMPMWEELIERVIARKKHGR